MHLTRNVAVFEVYNPYSIVQLSEVLSDVRILRGERSIYSGRAVVSNLVSTGLMLIVSATLIDPWSDLAGLLPGQGLGEEVEAFVKDWNASYKLDSPFQLAVTHLRAFLEELSRWLQQAEVAGPPVSDLSLKKEFLEEVNRPLDPKLVDLFGGFEHQAARVHADELHVHRAFAQRELHPLILCSPFVHRTFHKPLGYAGDYEMVNMILDEPWAGLSDYAKIINAFILAKDPAQAHRNRVELLGRTLKRESARNRNSAFRVLNIGCGPAREVQDFIRREASSEGADLHLLDFNEETLAYTRRRLEEACRDAGRKPRLTFHHKSIHDLLKDSARKEALADRPYDLVYCAGLFDYLSDRICARLLKLFHAWTAPGGFFLVTNVHRNNPIRHIMDFLLEWHLIYRNEAELDGLASGLGPGRTWCDPTGVNVFYENQKGVPAP